MGNLLKAPENVADLERILREHMPDSTPSTAELTTMLSNIGEMWEQLFPSEQKKMRVPGSMYRDTVEPAVREALVQANRCQNKLLKGEADSVGELALQQKN